MPVSTISYVREKARQALNSDENFLKRMLYFFELKVPAEVGVFGDTDFLFPLIIPPESYSMEEPFTVEATPTQGGGLYVEENGIVQRFIRIRGHTGFKPRGIQFPSSFGPVSAIIPPDKKSFTRELDGLAVGPFSGQRYFHYLQDSVFRTYADLKRDPAFSKDTALIFHNPRDEEHWLVAPQRFGLERDSGSPFLYRYNIELLVVDKAEERKADFSEDKSLFDSIKDALRAVKKALDMVTGAINDLTALVGELKSFVNDITKILDAFTSIREAVNNFIDGVTDLIASPYSAIVSLTEQCEAAAETISKFAAIPQTVEQKFRQAVDGLERLGSYPSLFEDPTDAVIRKIRKDQESRRRLTQTQKELALSEESPSTFDEVRNLGTKITAGDVTSAEGEVIAGGTIKKYRSVRQVSIGAGDSLVSLAAKYLGDARLWQYIAVVNGLKPPFVDKQASAPLVGSQSDGSQISGAASSADEPPFSGVLGLGSKILIPTNQKAPEDMPILTVMGVQTEEPSDNHFMGTDAKLEAIGDPYGSSRAQYDIPIDMDLGSVDIQVSQGLENMSQMLIIRLLTERGTDTLYKQLGVQRIIGLGMDALDFEIARFRILEALRNDSRVAAVRNLKLAQKEYDQLHVDADVEIRGLSQSRKVAAIL